jgi:hypothetical protein
LSVFELFEASLSTVLSHTTEKIVDSMSLRLHNGIGGTTLQLRRAGNQEVTPSGLMSVTRYQSLWRRIPKMREVHGF